MSAGVGTRSTFILLGINCHRTTQDAMYLPFHQRFISRSNNAECWLPAGTGSIHAYKSSESEADDVTFDVMCTKVLP